MRVDIARWFRSITNAFAPGYRRIEPAAAEPWRFDPLGWSDIWSRAAVIHFPSGHECASRFRSHARGRWGQERSSIDSGPTGEFRGFRVYEPGDDPRHVDWRATARARQAMVRERERETSSHVLIIVDVSASMWSTGDRPKAVRPIDAAFEMVVWIAAAALSRQMPLDIFLVSDRVEKRLIGMRGRTSLREIVDTLASFRPSSAGTQWEEAVEEVARRHSAARLFWLSDFTWLPSPKAFLHSLGDCTVYGVRFGMPDDLPASGSNLVRDVETGSIVCVPSRSTTLDQAERVQNWSQASNVPVLTMDLDETRPELVLSSWLKLAGMSSAGRG